MTDKYGDFEKLTPAPITDLVGKAKDAKTADEAMKYAQAALNASNALRGWK